MILKNNINKQAEQKQNHRYRKHFDGCKMGEGWGAWVKKMRGLRSTNRQLQNSHGDVKYSVGDGEAKELICMTHGHE